jgi:hypothetical protein
VEGRSVRRSAAEDRVAAVAAALAPYAWRELTERMLARRVVGASDQHGVRAFLTGVPGTDVGPTSPVEPADPGDERVDALVAALDGQQWRGWSLSRLCTDLLGWLQDWQQERESLEADLRRFREEH